jgi:hypothetical protein
LVTAYCASVPNDENHLAGVLCRPAERGCHDAISNQGVTAYRARQREKITMRIPQQVTERVKEAPAQALRAVFSGIGQVLLVADRIKSRASEPSRAHPAAAEPRAESGQRTATPAKDEARWRSLDETGNVRLLSEDDAPTAEPTAQTAPPATEQAAAEQAATEQAAAEQAAAEQAAAEQAAAEQAATEQAAAETMPGVENVPAAESVPAAAEPPARPTVAEPPAADQAANEAASPAAPAGPETAPAAATVAGSAAPAHAGLPVPNYDDLTVASLRARLRNLDASQVRVLLDHEKANAGRAAVLTMFERRIAKLESGEG